MPVRLAIRSGVEPGVSVTPGFELFDILGSTPQFQVSVPIDQSGELAPGQEVTLVHSDAEWSAVTAGSRTNLQSGSVTWDLRAPTGNGAPCAEDCERLILSGEPTRLIANIVVVEPLTGPSLPVAAILSSVADRTHIQTPHNETIPVTVLASDLGRRRALGATRGYIVRLVLSQAAITSSVGSLGGAAATHLYRWMSSQPVPALEFSFAVTILVTTASMLAGLIPAIVASNSDPIRVLRVP
ncbi:MAG: hypothetical protein OXB92_01650 [Acidimicrobiaceae bacterium]|nr:hypothetical protein [Acidimicrobiia bacterium]MCY4492545.1 hypothetical protein [Acidimicrobiaceae bacterium]